MSITLLTSSFTPYLAYAQPPLSDDDQAIPDWVKTRSSWWAKGQMDDSTFKEGISFLIQEKILIVPYVERSESNSDEIPEWIKTNVTWWTEGKIGDNTFVDGMQFMIKDGIINPYKTSTNTDSSLTLQDWEEIEKQVPVNKYFPKKYQMSLSDEEKQEKIIQFEEFQNVRKIINDPDLLPTESQKLFYYGYKMTDLEERKNVLSAITKKTESSLYKMEYEKTVQNFYQTNEKYKIQPVSLIDNSEETESKLICADNEFLGIVCMTEEEFLHQLMGGYWADGEFVVSTFNESEANILSEKLDNLYASFEEHRDEAYNTVLLCGEKSIPMQLDSSPDLSPALLDVFSDICGEDDDGGENTASLGTADGDTSTGVDSFTGISDNENNYGGLERFDLDGNSAAVDNAINRFRFDSYIIK
jgi:hypothetical protein